MEKSLLTENQERKKVLGKKKRKKKKKKQAQRRKKEDHSVEKRKISFVKETCNDEAPRWRPYFEQRSRRPTKICHTLIQNTLSTEADLTKIFLSITLISIKTKHINSMFIIDDNNKTRQQKRSIENRVSASRIIHRTIITQHNNFYYYLYACKTVVFIIIYSSIELTLVFDRTDFWFRSKRPSIELTCYQVTK